MSASNADLLFELTCQATSPAGRDWLSQEFEAARSPEGRGKVLVAFAGAGRRLGNAPLVSPEAGASPLPVSISNWSADDGGRVALLLAALPSVASADQVRFVEDLYYRGELGEKRAVLRALPLFDQQQRFVALGVEACRTNVVDLFEAIAVDNPFPAQHFDESSFNQMVMKALFLGVTARRIPGVDRRVTPELVRMLDDYRSERVAAGRPIPEDLTWLRGLSPET